MNEPILSYTEVSCTYPYAEDQASPKPGEMHVLRDADGKPEMVNFICPCGCNKECPTHVVSMEMKTNPEQSPWTRGCWGFDPKTLTLTPSIRWTGGCFAHFNITDGKVIMHADSGK